MAKKEVIICVTGSVAAYKACDLVSKLKKAGEDITVVMTKEAVEFVTPLLFESLSANRVYCEMFKSPEVWDPLHISLAEKADLVLIAPATANIIAKLAHGVCDDLATCIVMATKAPVLIAPAMNTNMYTHKATQENIRRLKAFGYIFVGPVRGRLACGLVGPGHIADTDIILKEAERLLKKQ